MSMQSKTPIKPTLTSKKIIDHRSHRIQLDRSAKTPFQSSSHILQRRDFRSELQPRASSRIAKPDNRVSSLISRLGFLSKASCNKSTNHVTRVNSEPSFKYQVQVNDKTYKILRKIGTGGSAKVYEGLEATTSQAVAIKIINVAKADAQTQESYFNEKSILSRLQDSRHVVRIYNSEYKADVKELIIVMEKGDADLSQILNTYFQTKNPNVVDGIFIKFYWRGMLMAVDEIHSYGIVHADLKPVNFVLVKNQVKLIDFGIATILDPDNTSIVRDYQIGTINYMAPETLKNRAIPVYEASTNDENDPKTTKKPNRTLIKYNSKADIWSLGCILYNFVYGRPPFHAYEDMIGKLQAITDPHHQIEYPQIDNLNLLNCMRSCLQYHPADRPSAKTLLTHPFLSEDLILAPLGSGIAQNLKPEQAP